MDFMQTFIVGNSPTLRTALDQRWSWRDVGQMALIKIAGNLLLELCVGIGGERRGIVLRQRQ
jgi:hypothetical protein